MNGRFGSAIESCATCQQGRALNQTRPDLITEKRSVCSIALRVVCRSELIRRLSGFARYLSSQDCQREIPRRAIFQEHAEKPGLPSGPHTPYRPGLGQLAGEYCATAKEIQWQAVETRRRSPIVSTILESRHALGGAAPGSGQPLTKSNKDPEVEGLRYHSICLRPGQKSEPRYLFIFCVLASRLAKSERRAGSTSLTAIPLISSD
jgi:hypothetical protein